MGTKITSLLTRICILAYIKIKAHAMLFKQQYCVAIAFADNNACNFIATDKVRVVLLVFRTNMERSTLIEVVFLQHAVLTAG